MSILRFFREDMVTCSAPGHYEHRIERKHAWSHDGKHYCHEAALYAAINQTNWSKRKDEQE